MCCRAFAAKERRKFANLEETEEAGGEVRGLRHVVGERKGGRRWVKGGNLSDSRFDIQRRGGSGDLPDSPARAGSQPKMRVFLK